MGVPRRYVPEVLRVIAPQAVAQRRCELRFAYGPLEVAGHAEPWDFDQLWDEALIGREPSLFLHPVVESISSSKKRRARKFEATFEVAEDIRTTWARPKFVTQIVDHVMACLCLVNNQC